MSVLYAKGTHAVGECGRCGRKRLLKDLTEDGYTLGLMVCNDRGCYDPPHPQDEPIVTTDAVALERPAPELSEPAGEGTPVDPASWLPPL